MQICLVSPFYAFSLGKHAERVREREGEGHRERGRERRRKREEKGERGREGKRVGQAHTGCIYIKMHSILPSTGRACCLCVGECL